MPDFQQCTAHRLPVIQGKFWITYWRMAFRALIFSKSTETNATMAEACATAGIRAEVCSDIFTAIEKGKTRAFSCLIVDWADQPEASFLLKRAREGAANRETLAIAIAEREPTQAERRDSRLDFFVQRPVSAITANVVLAQACEKMQPMTAEDERAAFEAENKQIADASRQTPVSNVEASEHVEPSSHAASREPSTALDHNNIVNERESTPASPAVGFRSFCAAVLVLIAAFLLWSSRDAILYLTRTPEGKIEVLRESLASLFYSNKTGAASVGSVASEAQQDAYFSRGPNSNGPTPTLKVAATESTLAEARIPLPKAPDFPLPQPVIDRPQPAPVHVQRAPIPESMRSSAPIERPVVVTVNPAQMMPVSAPLSQTQVPVQQFSEPVAISEEAERALLVHMVNPVYPAEGLAQKLHGPVILQAVVARDGSVQDLKIVRGYYVLGKAAIAAVKQWRFQPYTLNGHPASTQTVITVNFNYPPG